MVPWFLTPIVTYCQAVFKTVFVHSLMNHRISLHKVHCYCSVGHIALRNCLVNVESLTGAIVNCYTYMQLYIV